MDNIYEDEEEGKGDRFGYVVIPSRLVEEVISYNINNRNKCGDIQNA